MTLPCIAGPIARAGLDAAYGATWALANLPDVREFLHAKRHCEPCQDRGICPEHLEVARRLWFND